MTSICNLNITLGFLSINQDLFIKVQKKKIEGSIGSLMDRFYGGTREPRNCNFVSISGFGKKETNGSCTGVIKMFLERKLDLYSRFSNLMSAEEENFMEVSSTLNSEKIHFGQFANIPESQNVNSMAFLEHSLTIVEIILIGFLIISFFIFSVKLLNYQLIQNKNSRFRLNLTRTIKFFQLFPRKFKLLTKLNIMMISFSMFSQIMLSMLIANIKTNEVIVDTSDFIDTKSKLMNSKRYPCGFNDGPTFAFVLNAEKNSDMYRLGQRRKADGSICFLELILKDEILLNRFEIDKTFFLTGKSYVYFIFALFSKLADKDKILFETSIFENDFVQVFYMASLIKRDIKIKLIKKLLRSFENGLFMNFHSEMNNAMKNLIKVENLFTDTKSLKNEFIKVQTIKFRYFQNLIFYLFLIYFILFSFLIFVHLFRLAKRNKHKIRHYVNHCKLVIITPFVYFLFYFINYFNSSNLYN